MPPCVEGKNKEAEAHRNELLPPCLHQGLDDGCNSEEAQRSIDPDFNGDLRSFHNEALGSRRRNP
jgi:hypothetical protein